MPDMQDRMQQLMNDLEDQSRKAAELQSAVQDIRGVATSPDRSVTVTAAPSGAVLDIDLSPEATRQPHTALKQTIMATIHAAVQQAAQQLNSAAAPILGNQLEQFQEALRDSGPETPPAQTPARPPQRPTDQDDDFSNETFLR